MSKDYNQFFDKAVAEVKEFVPDFEIRFKDKSWSSKLIALLLWLFNPDYMTKFTTTRYPKVYFPSEEYMRAQPMKSFKILMHEFVHMWDRKTKGRRFSIGYMFPQFVGVVLFLSAFVLGFVLTLSQWPIMLAVFIPALIFLAPLPAYWRMKAEMRGYAMNLAINYWRYGAIREDTKKWLVETFTGKWYYFMWPFAKDVRKRIDDLEYQLNAGAIKFIDLLSNTPRNDEAYKLAWRLLRDFGELKQNGDV